MRTTSAVLLALGLALLALGCLPGVEEGSFPRDAAAVEGARPDRVLDQSPRELVPDHPVHDAWACIEFFDNNFNHVVKGRATTSGGHAYAEGSADDLGFYNTAVSTWLRETKKGYFEKGRCP